jgi:hypothetical protein
VDWIDDHLIVLAAIVLGVLIIVTATVTVVRGLALWRKVKRSRGVVEPLVEPIQRESAMIERRMARITAAQTELDIRLQRLQIEVAEVKVLAAFGTAALATLRSPLRYLGK